MQRIPGNRLSTIKATNGLKAGRYSNWIPKQPGRGLQQTLNGWCVVKMGGNQGGSRGTCFVSGWVMSVDM